MRFACTRLTGLMLTLGVLILCSLAGHSSLVEGLTGERKDDKGECAGHSRGRHSRGRHSRGRHSRGRHSRGRHSPGGDSSDDDARDTYARVTPGDAKEGRGLTREQIPSGDEGLYILKSEVVPPVCPACPAAAACPRPKPCPPCPPCARCPEPAFDCKKVPNYRNNGNSYLPHPVLSDFSQFGM
jgi:hypothetical protein